MALACGLDKLDANVYSGSGHIEVAMRFPMIVYQSEGSGYGGLLPDFPGCYPMGETLEALVTDARAAIETWLEGEDPAIFPIPSELETVQASPDAQGRALVLVDINTAFGESVTEPVNITVPCPDYQQQR